MLKKILITLGVLILLFLAAVVVLIIAIPGGYKVERQITINRPRADVYAYTRILKNQNQWGPWIKRDPNIKLTYTGTDGEPGFIVAWQSNEENVGQGEQQIKTVSEGRIDTALRFIKPFESQSDSYIILTPIGENQTQVTWGFTGKFPRPTNLMLLFFNMDEAVGKDFEEGLNNLKEILESQK